jgi:hypothetical protein
MEVEGGAEAEGPLVVLEQHESITSSGRRTICSSKSESRGWTIEWGKRNNEATNC